MPFQIVLRHLSGRAEPEEVSADWQVRVVVKNAVLVKDGVIFGAGDRSFEREGEEFQVVAIAPKPPVTPKLRRRIRVALHYEDGVREVPVSENTAVRDLTFGEIHLVRDGVVYKMDDRPFQLFDADDAPEFEVRVIRPEPEFMPF